jgi:hypothetical protein
LVDRVLEVRREPTPSARAPYGWDYDAVTILSASDHVRALAAPTVPIVVADLLP